ncbi:transcription factor jun-B-like isoform X1 [Hippocampus comes]|uniref:JunB proto-onco, AP-1 transcription factor subunit n=2 Tax=Hippocampus comes TaxID=109280 RepID=A0A3Q2YRF8_HIPCM|nr:PREDICTED: transcription factor jun-B-like isoform X1 [Hippocampus comes]
MSSIMEQPFYDDSFLSAYGHPGAALSDYKLLKQNMNLNLSDPYRSSNFKSHHLRADSELYSAATADPGSLKLASPDLERLIIQNSNGLITTTPTPSQYLYNRGITEEQEGFAEGFVKALDDLHKMNQMAPPNVSIGTGGVACSAPGSVYGSPMQPEPLEYTNLGSCSTNPGLSSAVSYPSATISYLPHHPYHHPHPQSHHPHGGAHAPHSFQHSLAGAGLHAPRFSGLKEEPQTVPDMPSSDNSSPPMSPIDLENQERIKAERKRLRNRLAASKCRRRKLERIARLEDRVKVLKTDNAGLSNTASLLREQVAQLKQKVMTHVSSGCQLMLSPKVKSY